MRPLTDQPKANIMWCVCGSVWVSLCVLVKCATSVASTNSKTGSSSMFTVDNARGVRISLPSSSVTSSNRSRSFIHSFGSRIQARSACFCLPLLPCPSGESTMCVSLSNGRFYLSSTCAHTYINIYAQIYLYID